MGLVVCLPPGPSKENPVSCTLWGEEGLIGQPQVCGDPAHPEAGINLYS